MHRTEVASRGPEWEARIREVAERYGGDGDGLLAEMRNAEMWVNDRYTVVVDRFEDGAVSHLSIRRNDRKPCRDWREFQRLKDDIAGPDVEAIELYPAAERVVDTANQYHLWCLPPGARVPAGYEQGLRLEPEDADAATGAVQRPGAISGQG